MNEAQFTSAGMVQDQVKTESLEHDRDPTRPCEDICRFRARSQHRTLLALE